MNRTVDLVIVGLTAAALAAATAAADRGQLVLVVDETGNRSCCGRFRRALAAAGTGVRERVSLVTGLEVVCVDGVAAVEVVLLRRLRTGSLLAINARAWLATTPVPAGVFSSSCCLRDEVSTAPAEVVEPG